MYYALFHVLLVPYSRFHFNILTEHNSNLEWSLKHWNDRQRNRDDTNIRVEQMQSRVFLQKRRTLSVTVICTIVDCGPAVTSLKRAFIIIICRLYLDVSLKFIDVLFIAASPPFNLRVFLSCDCWHLLERVEAGDEGRRRRFWWVRTRDVGYRRHRFERIMALAVCWRQNSGCSRSVFRNRSPRSGAGNCCCRCRRRRRCRCRRHLTEIERPTTS